MTERRKKFPALSDIVEGAPDFREWMPDLTPLRPESVAAAGPGDDDGDDDTSYTPL